MWRIPVLCYNIMILWNHRQCTVHHFAAHDCTYQHLL